MSPAPAAEGDRTAEGSLRRLLALRTDQQPLADGLVRLEEIPRSRLVAEARRLRRELLTEHPALWSGRLGGSSARESVLREEHRRFEISMAELEELLSLALRDGGHRQALGQYWRLVLESLELHLRDEATLLEGVPTPARGVVRAP